MFLLVAGGYSRVGACDPLYLLLFNTVVKRKQKRFISFVQVLILIRLLSFTVSFFYRHKCIACFKQYKKKEHLVEHMKNSHHSVHQPKCGVCKKHCRTFESLREHVTGE